MTLLTQSNTETYINEFIINFYKIFNKINHVDDNLCSLKNITKKYCVEETSDNSSLTGKYYGIGRIALPFKHFKVDNEETIESNHIYDAELQIDNTISQHHPHQDDRFHTLGYFLLPQHKHITLLPFCYSQPSQPWQTAPSWSDLEFQAVPLDELLDISNANVNAITPAATIYALDSYTVPNFEKTLDTCINMYTHLISTLKNAANNFLLYTKQNQHTPSFLESHYYSLAKNYIENSYINELHSSSEDLQ